MREREREKQRSYQLDNSIDKETLSKSIFTTIHFNFFFPLTIFNGMNQINLVHYMRIMIGIVIFIIRNKKEKML